MTKKRSDIIAAFAASAMRKSVSRSPRRLLHAEYFHCIETGSKLDLDAVFHRARTQCFHWVRMGFISLSAPMAAIAGAEIAGYEQLSSNAIAALMTLVVFSLYWGWVFFSRAADLFIRKSDFEKKDWGASILKKWAAADPSIQQFLIANNSLKSLSIFEFELVQTYVFRNRFGLA
jgi:hypothetical protein